MEPPRPVVDEISESSILDGIETEKGVSVGTTGFAGIIDEAKAAAAKEQNMTLWQGIKSHPKAIGWSVLMSTAIIMEGYDTVLISSFYAMDTFNRQFGSPRPDGRYELSASWQAGLTNSMPAGQIIGLYANGYIADRYGYKKTMFGALILVIGFVFISFFAQTLPILVIGQVLLGVPLGAFQALSSTYAAEVCPVVLRSYLTTFVNACWCIGQLLASGVLRSMLSRDDEWGYRIPFALQWIWPIPIMIGVLFAPESPYWLVRNQRLKDAERALARLGNTEDPNFNAQEAAAMIAYTNEQERERQTGTSYLDCFRGSDLRRTEICCLTWACQSLCGSGLMGFSTYFYKNAGLGDTGAFNLTLGQYGIGLIGTLVSWGLMIYFGRRTIYLYGLVLLDVCLLLVGFVSLAPEDASKAWATGSMLLIYAFVYNGTVGPVCYSLVNEMPSTRLRQKTVVLARSTYNLFSIVNGIVIPYMLNPTTWNWAGKSGFFWAGVCFACVVYVFFRLPEPKGRTYAELDALFAEGYSARKFAGAKVNPFNSLAGKARSATEHKEADSSAASL